MTEYQILVKRLRLAVDHALNALSEYVEQEETRNNLKTILEEYKKQLNKFEKMLHDKNNPAIAKLISSQCTLLQNAAESLFVKIDLSKDNEFEKKLIEILGEEIRAVFKLPATLSLEDLRDEAKALLFDSTLESFKSVLEQQSIEAHSCFISYAWGDSAIERKVHKIAQQLLSAGVNVVLDVWHNRTNSIIQFTQRVYKEDFVLVIGSSLLKQKYELSGQYGSYVREELEHIGIRIKERQGKQKFPFGSGVLKVLVENPHWGAFPDFLKPYPFDETDFTNEHHYYDKFFNLLDHLFVKSSEAKKVLSHTKVQFKQDSEGLKNLKEEELKRYLIQDATDEQTAEQLKSIREKLAKASAKGKRILIKSDYQTHQGPGVHYSHASNTNQVQAANHNIHDGTDYSASSMQSYKSFLEKKVGTSFEIDIRKNMICTRYMFLKPTIPPINEFFCNNHEILKEHISNHVANCEGINLSKTDLTNSNFSRSNFKNANFYKSILKNVKLYKTELEGANITKVRKLRSNQLAEAVYQTIIATDDKTITRIRKAEVEKKERQLFTLQKFQELSTMLLKYKITCVEIKHAASNSDIQLQDRLKIVDILNDEDVKEYLKFLLGIDFSFNASLTQ